MSNTRYPLLRPKLRPLLIRGEVALRKAMKLTYHFSQDETLISDGEESNAVFLLESGWITRTRVANNGSRQISGIFLPGDLIGIESILLERQSDTVECLTSAHVRIIDRENFLKLIAQNHAVSARAMLEISEDNRRLRNWGTALGKGRADQRIAIFLIDLYRRLHRAGLVEGNRFWMPMRQPEIADHLGLSTEYLNRVLRQLRESGIVTVRTEIVTIDRMARLSQLAAPLQDIYERDAQTLMTWSAQGSGVAGPALPALPLILHRRTNLP